MKMLTYDERIKAIDDNVNMLRVMFIKSLDVGKDGRINANINECIEKFYTDTLLTFQTMDETYKDQVMTHMFTSIISNDVLAGCTEEPRGDDEKE